MTPRSSPKAFPGRKTYAPQTQPPFTGYEGGARVPFIARWRRAPDNAKAARKP